jgi:hypothetical protein
MRAGVVVAAAWGAALIIGASAAQATPTTNAGRCLDAQGNVRFISDVDRNPSNTPVAPTLGHPLIARRSDGHIPFGFNDHLPEEDTPYPLSLDDDRALHEHVGANISRITMNWEAAEPSAGTFNWFHADQRYCNARLDGTLPVLTILRAPAWAGRSSSADNGPESPQFDGALTTFAEALAIRYPGSAIEVWNEPNLSQFWELPLSAARYSQVLHAAYTGVKDGDPSIPVISGGLSNPPFDGSNSQGSWQSFSTYLDQMYANGAGNWMDGVGIHPYPVHRLSDTQNPGSDDYTRFYETFDGNPAVGLRGIRQIIAAHDPPGRRIWVDEFGATWNASAGPHEWSSEQQVSDDLLTAYRWLDQSSDVDMAAFHSLVATWCDQTKPLCNPDANPSFNWVKQGLDTLKRPIPHQFFARADYCTFANTYGPGLNCAQPIPGANP